MHKTVTDYAVPRCIHICRVSENTTRKAIRHDGSVYDMRVPAGSYYLVSPIHGYVTQVSRAATAKSAIIMMKRYCR